MAPPHVRSRHPFARWQHNCTGDRHAMGPCFTGASVASASGTRVLGGVATIQTHEPRPLKDSPRAFAPVSSVSPDGTRAPSSKPLQYSGRPIRPVKPNAPWRDLGLSKNVPGGANRSSDNLGLNPIRRPATASGGATSGQMILSPSRLQKPFQLFAHPTE